MKADPLIYGPKQILKHIRNINTKILVVLFGTIMALIGITMDKAVRLSLSYSNNDLLLDHSMTTT